MMQRCYITFDLSILHGLTIMIYNFSHFASFASLRKALIMFSFHCICPYVCNNENFSLKSTNRLS